MRRGIRRAFSLLGAVLLATLVLAPVAGAQQTQSAAAIAAGGTLPDTGGISFTTPAGLATGFALIAGGLLLEAPLALAAPTWRVHLFPFE